MANETNPATTSSTTTVIRGNVEVDVAIFGTVTEDGDVDDLTAEVDGCDFLLTAAEEREAEERLRDVASDEFWDAKSDAEAFAADCARDEMRDQDDQDARDEAAQ